MKCCMCDICPIYMWLSKKVYIWYKKNIKYYNTSHLIMETLIISFSTYIKNFVAIWKGRSQCYPFSSMNAKEECKSLEFKQLVEQLHQEKETLKTTSLDLFKIKQNFEICPNFGLIKSCPVPTYPMNLGFLSPLYLMLESKHVTREKRKENCGKRERTVFLPFDYDIYLHHAPPFSNLYLTN